MRLIPVNDLVRLDGPASGFSVIGAGKTAMDACLWLLEASGQLIRLDPVVEPDAAITAQCHQRDPRLPRRPADESALAHLFANIEPALAKLETFVATTLHAKISRSGAAGSPASAG